MKKLILNYLNNIKMGDKQTYKNMVVFPLLCDEEITLDYLLLDEMVATDQVVITETYEEEVFIELMIENTSGENLLILDGEGLVDSKQNTAANVTMLIPAHTALTIPISCVERRRWFYQGRGVLDKERVMLKRSTAINESLITYESFRADQNEIWDVVGEKKTPFHADAPTSTYVKRDICEHEQKTLDEYLKHFEVEDNQVGILVLLNNGVAGCDCFGKQDTLSKTFSKLIKTYVLDAMDDPKKRCTFSERKASGFINGVRLSTLKGRPSISLGTDLRLESQKVIGSALSVGKELVHLTAFVKKEKDYKKKVRFMGS